MKISSRTRTITTAIAHATALVSGLFVLLVLILMIMNVLHTRRTAPLDTPHLTTLRTAIAEHPTDSALRDQVRSLDALARRAFFASRDFTRQGAILLLIGGVLFIVSSKLSIALESESDLPDRRPLEAEPARQAQGMRWAVTASGVLVLGAALSLIVLTQDAPSLNAPPPETEASPPAQLAPAWDTVRQNWPSFRGPGGIGIAGPTRSPTEWDGPSGLGIRWKTPIPRFGRNSPIVWESSVYLSGADKDVLEVYCFDAESGVIRWTAPVSGVPGAPGQRPEVGEDTGYAAPSLATDGRYVFAIFGTGDLIALDNTGERVWARNVGTPDISYGHASSLLVHDGLLYVQYDHNESANLYAYAVATGELIWDQTRDVSASWCSPALARTDSGDLLVLAASPYAIAYDTLTGREQWRAKCLSGETAPSPAFAGNLAIVAFESPAVTAIDIGTGDIRWSYDEYPPDVPSPVATTNVVILVGSDGFVTCLDTPSGELLWEHEIDAAVYGSPILVGDSIYLLDDEGQMSIFKASPSFEQVGQCDLGENVLGTPAFTGNRIYIRGKQHLYCVE